MEPWKKAIVASLYVIAIICYFIMKKIQPDSSKLYLAWEVFVLILFTSFAIAAP